MAPHADARSMQGFSLLELMVALAIFALIVVGLLSLAGESTRTLVFVEEDVLAGLVAENVSAEARLLAPEDAVVAAQGVERLGERDWRWRRSAAATGSDGLVRIDIDVRRPDDDGVVATASVFR